MRLVLIETLGNQAYVFSSNRLREMIGASELIRQLGKVWVPRVSSDLGARVLLATSGKALVLANNTAEADALVARVVREALEQASGLSVMGAHVEVDLAVDARGFDVAVAEVHRELSRLRGLFPSAHAHLARLPFAEDCRSTGAGAAGYDPFDPASHNTDTPFPYSAITLQKRRALATAKGNLIDALQLNEAELHKYDQRRGAGSGTPRDIYEFDSTWRAVVHADGNGMGEVFLRFGDCVVESGGNTVEDYIEAYAAFSKALDEANSNAVYAATQSTWKEFFSGKGREKWQVPMKPIVLAGDDLTVICDGARAVQFAEAFIEHFRVETAKATAIEKIMRAAEAVFAREQKREPRPYEGITSGAGVAIVKSHHPFHRAYELADALAKSAKGLPKRLGLSAVDFHVSYDGASDLQEIRQPRQSLERLFAGPYLTGIAGHEEHAFLTVSQLVNLANGFGASQADGDASQSEGAETVGRIPGAQLHALRDSVTQGEAVAQAALARIEERYRPAFERLKGLISPLFVDGLDGGPRRTMLLDAMVLADVLAADPVKADEFNGEAA